MLDYLDTNFDEEWLRANYLPRKLRCQSITQSYNIYDSKDYYDAYANSWLHKAEMILQNPFMNPTINAAGKPKSTTAPAPVADSRMDQSAVGISQRALVATETADDEAVFNQANIPQAQVTNDEANLDEENNSPAQARDDAQAPKIEGDDEGLTAENLK